MTNYEIADHFSLLSKLMDIHGEDSFKTKSYGIAAYNIEKLPKEISEMDDAELFSMKGIGKSTGEKIKELQTTGKLPQLEKILSVTPHGILEMLEIKGIGPKKIAVIWKEMGIESVGELEYACNENRLVAYKGFGAKTQESILQSINYIKQNQGFHLWAEVAAIGNALLEQLQKTFPNNRFSLAGDVRRQVEVVECIDIVTDVEQAALLQYLKSMPENSITEEPIILSVKMAAGPLIKFHIASSAAYHNRLFTVTGNIEFVEAFNEKYTLPNTPESEEAIFAENNLAYIVPALRESAAILDRAVARTMPELIQPQDIKSIIHSHSTWSDGSNTIEQMAKAAIEKGLEYMVISDHSQSAFYANGLKPDRIAAQHQEVDALNEKLKPFKIFKSIEVDILNDGSLDYSNDVLGTLDLVIASVHSNLKMSEEKAMNRVLTAIRNPYTTILGHPTGRLLLSRAGYPIDHKRIIDECTAHNVVIEINAHPRRLDIDWRWLEYATEKGVLLSIDPDAHSIAGYEDTYYGVMVAQKGGLTAKQNLSSFTLAEFEQFLQRYNKKRGA